MADPLGWILQQDGVSELLHYLDDFLMMPPPLLRTLPAKLGHYKKVFTHLQLGIPQRWKDQPRHFHFWE